MWLTMIAVAYALPQLLYRRTTAHWLLPLVPLLRGLAWLARPVRGAARLLPVADRPRRRCQRPTEEPPTPAENIEALISAGTEEGLIEEEDRKLIQSVVEFGDKVVREVMTPRPNIVAISGRCHPRAAAPTGDPRAVFAHSRFTSRTSTRSIGFVHVRDMFEARRRGARPTARCASWCAPFRSCPKPSR